MQNSSFVRGSEVIDRADSRRSLLNTAWPLGALALLVLILLRACVPATPAAVTTAAPPSFDTAAAARQANDAALEALQALPPGPELADVLAALNALVINFAVGSDTVPDDAAEPLKAAASVIAALPPGTRVLITGHTDSMGDAAANLVLSRRRAQAVRAALIGHGASAAALSVHGVGDGRPVADNGSEAGRFRNRRIEFSAAS